MHRENLIVEIGVEDGVARHSQLRTDEQRLDAAEEEKYQRGRQIQDADLFVIDRHDPVEQTARGYRPLQNLNTRRHKFSRVLFQTFQISYQCVDFIITQWRNDHIVTWFDGLW